MVRFISSACIAVIASALLGTPAHASGGVWCNSKDKQAYLAIGLGRLPIYSQLNANAQLGIKQWHTDPKNGETPLGGSQGFIENDHLSVDFTDENIEKIIISLRVDYSGEESENGYPGTLVFEGKTPIDVLCEFE